MVHDALPFQRSIDSVHLYPFVTVIEKREVPLDVLVAEKRGTEWQPFYDDQPTSAPAISNATRALRR
jgi:hypothetical protein